MPQEFFKHLKWVWDVQGVRAELKDDDGKVLCTFNLKYVPAGLSFIEYLETITQATKNNLIKTEEYVRKN